MHKVEETVHFIKSGEALIVSTQQHRVKSINAKTAKTAMTRLEFLLHVATEAASIAKKLVASL